MQTARQTVATLMVMHAEIEMMQWAALAKDFEEMGLKEKAARQREKTRACLELISVLLSFAGETEKAS